MNEVLSIYSCVSLLNHRSSFWDSPKLCKRTGTWIGILSHSSSLVKGEFQKLKDLWEVRTSTRKELGTIYIGGSPAFARSGFAVRLVRTNLSSNRKIIIPSKPI